jgi:hypothetical protein
MYCIVNIFLLQLHCEYKFSYMSNVFCSFLFPITCTYAIIIMVDFDVTSIYYQIGEHEVVLRTIAGFIPQSALPI